MEKHSEVKKIVSTKILDKPSYKINSIYDERGHHALHYLNKASNNKGSDNHRRPKARGKQRT